MGVRKCGRSFAGHMHSAQPRKLAHRHAKALYGIDLRDERGIRQSGHIANAETGLLRRLIQERFARLEALNDPALGPRIHALLWQKPACRALKARETGACMCSTSQQRGAPSYAARHP